MKVKVPREIEIGGFKIKLDASDEATEILIGVGFFGEYIKALRLIRIRNNLTQQEWANTLYHELGHAINDLYLNSKWEERDVAVYANGIHQVMNQIGAEFDWSDIK